MGYYVSSGNNVIVSNRENKLEKPMGTCFMLINVLHLLKAGTFKSY